jgi:hypothetical protein
MGVPDNSQDYGTDAFYYLFKDRFANAVAAHPTPDRTAAVNLLSDFTGGLVEGDETAIINSPDISDKWLLAQQWVWEVQSAIIGPTFGNAYPYFPISSDKAQSGGFYYTDNVIGLVARLLQVSDVNNAVCYQNWLTSLGDIDLLIANALDTALNTLGGLSARPWGTGQRPNAVYTNNILGPLSFSCNSPLVCNRAGIYMSTEFDNNNGLSASCVCSGGQSGLILFNQYGVPTVQDDAQMCDFVNFNLVNLGSSQGVQL